MRVHEAAANYVRAAGSSTSAAVQALATLRHVVDTTDIGALHDAP